MCNGIECRDGVKRVGSKHYCGHVCVDELRLGHVPSRHFDLLHRAVDTNDTESMLNERI
jgi:hypothetical protein